jgi:2-keto-4-pentenoate hydratase
MTRADASMSVIEQCADALANAERIRRPMRPLTELHPGLSIGDAYGVQRNNVARRKRAGERIVGHKVGLTAVAMQELFGVHEPDFGHLLDTMVHDAAMPLDLSELIDPQIEVEPAFVLARPLSGPGLTSEDVLAATEYVSVCFEVIDSRIVDWNIRVQDTVADNGSSARVVIGSLKVLPGTLRLDNLETILQLDGQVVERGNTSAILGHPANGVAWLGNKLAEFGIALQAGDVVLPGTCTRCRRIAGHRIVKGSIAGLGEISLRLENSPSIVDGRQA